MSWSRAALGTVAAIVAIAVGVLAGELTKPAASGAGSPAPTVSPTASHRPPPPKTFLPDGSSRLFPGHRVVAYYGAAGAPALGVLGTASAEGIWPRLDAQAREFDHHGPAILPAYELITFVATGSGGPDGDYSQRIPDSTIQHYVTAARQHHALLILDIQPGRGEFLPDAQSLARWLRLPDVALAIDPEWKLYGHQVPDRQIGHTDATAINQVSAWLDRLTAAQNLPQKLLLVHQFTPDMVHHKSQVASRAHLAMVFNMDGFGARAVKLAEYHDLARDRRFPIGLKLFYSSDKHRFTPTEAVRLHPAPAVVDYE
jgi:hypothetical protein